MAFRESVEVVDSLVKQQMMNLERYGRFIGDPRRPGEINIQDARKIVHIRHPRYEPGNRAVSDVRSIRETVKNLEGEEMLSAALSALNPSFGPYMASCTSPSFGDYRVLENMEDRFDPLCFDEGLIYEEGYLLSNEAQDYYCRCGLERSHFPLELQDGLEFDILEDFLNKTVFPDFKSHISSSKFGEESASPLHLDSIVSVGQAPVSQQSGAIPESSSDSDSNILPKCGSLPEVTLNSNYCLSPIFTPRNTHTSDDFSVRLVNRSISRLKPESSSTTQDHEPARALEGTGYCHTSSFFTANSVE
ncbi:hypothetical protein OJ253_1995 [Cryptosporidium canis]|uniref:Uncharacterized protein n=1 Tax=Cryptosporidium canis TaxID=195482 RepID=A0A9D5DK60_9CRYT|nr:hypothetical protein OJ253_1995 [Cryptosporidium canis]